MARLAMGAEEIKASHFELNVEPGPHFPNQFILNALGEIPV
jgi:hypothetical protein